MLQTKRNLLLTCLFTVTYGVFGCGEASKPQPGPVQTAHDDHTHDHKDGHGHSHDKKSHDHSGWWCDEHGVPEGECAQCDSKVAAAFQKKGDWCKEHDRPDSQCFICHPEKLEEYAAKYEAKLGKKPPKPELN